MASSSSSSSFSSPTNSGSPTFTSIQTPMILLSNISNLVSVKLNQNNYVLWKYQITSILKAYNILGFVDGTQSSPAQFLTSNEGITKENPFFQQWISRDQSLLTQINSTLSPIALSSCLTYNSSWSLVNSWEAIHFSFTIKHFESQNETSQYQEGIY